MRVEVGKTTNEQTYFFPLCDYSLKLVKLFALHDNRAEGLNFSSSNADVQWCSTVLRYSAVRNLM